MDINKAQPWTIYLQFLNKNINKVYFEVFFFLQGLEPSLICSKPFSFSFFFSFLVILLIKIYQLNPFVTLDAITESPSANLTSSLCSSLRFDEARR